MEDFRKYKFRTPPGIPGQTYKDIGVASVAMGGGMIFGYRLNLKVGISKHTLSV